MAEARNKDLIGILGGMGPLASAEFLKTLYESSLGDREQDSPAVLMLSDPGIPDRTEELLRGSSEELDRRLVDGLNRLLDMGATKIVICCVTSHYLLPRLPDQLRSHVISLLDATLAVVGRSQKRHLMICTNGTRKLRLFESHSLWQPLKNYVQFPDDGDQEMIHQRLIYQIKRNGRVDEMIPLIEYLLSKYGIDSFISGCTELHLLTKRLMSDRTDGNYSFVDPLMIIAKELAERDYGASTGSSNI